MFLSQLLVGLLLLFGFGAAGACVLSTSYTLPS